MLLLIHQCQHDIKVGQGGEIIQAGWRQQLILDWRLRPNMFGPSQTQAGSSTYLHLTFAHRHIVCAKGPGTLKGLASCVFLVLPGLQMDSKADHSPHAN